jgi:hypothetical protein
MCGGAVDWAMRVQRLVGLAVGAAVAVWTLGAAVSLARALADPRALAVGALLLALVGGLALAGRRRARRPPTSYW